MVPTLMCVLSLQRSLSYAYVTDSEFDFASTHVKIQQEGYILFNEREQLSLVLGEVGLKGILPASIQFDFLNFAVLWYNFSSFLIQSFGLLYYRKYREN